MEKKNKAFAYRIYSHFTQQCGTGRFLDIGLFLTLHIAKKLNVHCAVPLPVVDQIWLQQSLFALLTVKFTFAAGASLFDELQSVPLH